MSSHRKRTLNCPMIYLMVAVTVCQVFGKSTNQLTKDNCEKDEYWSNGECRTCLICPQGQELSQFCGYGDGKDAKCINCIEGETFNPHHPKDDILLSNRRCLMCTNCEGFKRDYKFKCRKEINAVCGNCNFGYYNSHKGALDGGLYPCTSCKYKPTHPDCATWLKHTQVEVTKVQDTEKLLNATSLPTTTLEEETKENPRLSGLHDPKEMDNSSTKNFIVAIVVLVLLIITLVIVMIKLLNDKRVMPLEGCTPSGSQETMESHQKDTIRCNPFNRNTRGRNKSHDNLDYQFHFNSNVEQSMEKLKDDGVPKSSSSDVYVQNEDSNESEWTKLLCVPDANCDDSKETTAKSLHDSFPGIEMSQMNSQPNTPGNTVIGCIKQSSRVTPPSRCDIEINQKALPYKYPRYDPSTDMSGTEGTSFSGLSSGNQAVAVHSDEDGSQSRHDPCTDMSVTGRQPLSGGSSGFSAAAVHSYANDLQTQDEAQTAPPDTDLSASVTNPLSVGSYENENNINPQHHSGNDAEQVSNFSGELNGYISQQRFLAQQPQRQEDAISDIAAVSNPPAASEENGYQQGTRHETAYAESEQEWRRDQQTSSETIGQTREETNRRNVISDEERNYQHALESSKDLLLAELSTDVIDPLGLHLDKKHVNNTPGVKHVRHLAERFTDKIKKKLVIDKFETFEELLEILMYYKITVKRLIEELRNMERYDCCDLVIEWVIRRYPYSCQGQHIVNNTGIQEENLTVAVPEQGNIPIYETAL